MGIRLETEWDYEPVRRLNNAAFGRSVEAKLVDQLRESDAFVPNLTLVAEQSSIVIGHIMLSYVTLDPDPGTRVLSLAPMAVYPAFQNRGVGSALVREALARADSRGEPLVLVLGHPEYYPRFGFVPARPMGIEPPNPDIPDEAFMVKTLSTYREDLRGVVNYPPVFDMV